MKMYLSWEEKIGLEDSKLEANKSARSPGAKKLHLNKSVEERTELFSAGDIHTDGKHRPKMEISQQSSPK